MHRLALRLTRLEQQQGTLEPRPVVRWINWDGTEEDDTPLLPGQSVLYVVRKAPSAEAWAAWCLRQKNMLPPED